MTDKGGRNFWTWGCLREGFVVRKAGGLEGTEQSERSRSWVGKMPERFRACGEGDTVKTWVKKSHPR